MNMMKKTATFAWVLAALLAIAPSSQAQPIFPNKSVRIVVPFAPGGSSDSTARVIAEHLTAKWKQWQPEIGLCGYISCQRVAQIGG